LKGRLNLYTLLVKNKIILQNEIKEVFIEMDKKQTFQIFKKNHLFIITIDNEKIQAPDFVIKSISTYRFDDEKLELQKSCYMCRKWFAVAKLEDKKWKDIHDEKKIHLVPSGYGAYCLSCAKIKDNKLDNNKQRKESKGDKYSIVLLDRHKKYIKIRATAEDKTITKVLEEILEEQIERNPIEKFL
jgi:hypothetical protein